MKIQFKAFRSRKDLTPPIKHVRSREERALVWRLDCCLLVFGCIQQIIKYLDQMNINNAYVSGMKEDLNLYGNELNFFTTYFNVAYCIMLIPSQILLTYIRPSIWFPCLELAWGTVTGLIAMTKSAKQVYALRFFLGFFESTAYPGMITLFMHWYTPTELAKRIGLYHSCQPLGNMMSGAIASAVISSLDGHAGLAGWRWMFIVNAIITVCWAVFGFFMLPDLPDRPNPRAFWFNKQHQELAIERLNRNHRVGNKKMTWAGVKRTFSSRIVYVLATLYIAQTIGTGSYGYFVLFLKYLTNSDGSKTWNAAQINAIPIGGSAINVVTVWMWAMLSDFFVNRWLFIIAQCLIGLIPCIIMSIWTSNPDKVALSAAYASYFMTYTVLGMGPLQWSYMSDILAKDPEARSLIIGVSISLYYGISSWSQVLVWPAVQAPFYKYGWQSSVALLTLTIVMTCTLRFLDVTVYRQRVLEGIDAVEDGSGDCDGVESALTDSDQKVAITSVDAKK
ncbi:allantoate permease [Cadophora sp. DSE1049]|nr:allantoate permease [Cadophora sp. DSE1049]